MPYKYRWYHTDTPEERLQVFAYSIRLIWLRTKFAAQLGDEADDETVA